MANAFVVLVKFDGIDEEVFYPATTETEGRRMVLYVASKRPDAEYAYLHAAMLGSDPDRAYVAPRERFSYRRGRGVVDVAAEVNDAVREAINGGD